ncbi:hypothetical protein DTM45_27240 [Escherichia coli]|nr:hypothetical protein DTM45_27240 [Escherichia coli]
MTSLKTSIKTITYLSDTGCLEIQGASLLSAAFPSTPVILLVILSGIPLPFSCIVCAPEK